MFVLTTLAVAALVSSGRLSATADHICELNLQDKLEPHDEPLIFEVIEFKDNKEQIDFIRPEVEMIKNKPNGVIHVAENKKLLIACTGPKNANAATNQQTAYATCTDGNLIINNKPANKNTLSCTDGAAKSWLEKTTNECGDDNNKGTMFELGFKLTDEKPPAFFPLVDVCHNTGKMVSYYAAHQVYGASLKGAVKSSDRKAFVPGPKSLNLFIGVEPNKAYSQAGQKETFDLILGENANEMYISEKVYLARGHLAPDADFIYHSGQLLTYYFINVAPQWQTFNAGNWLGIENAVRDLAAKESATVSVWTGTYGVLKLEDLNGEEKEIYLDYRGPNEQNHIPVPEVYWKLVQHPVTKSCTVAVGHNNVFLKKPPTPICDSVKDSGWPELTQLDKGYVYYCSYDSFIKTVTYVPKVECKDIFKFPLSEPKKKLRKSKSNLTK